MHVVVSYLYVDDERIVMRVVKTTRIFFQESDNGAFFPCCLWYGARQLNILDYPKVSFAGFFGQPSGYCPSYDHPYVPYQWSWMFIIPTGELLLREYICSLLPDKLLQFPLLDKSLNLLL